MTSSKFSSMDRATWRTDLWDAEGIAQPEKENLVLPMQHDEQLWSGTLDHQEK